MKQYIKHSTIYFVLVTISICTACNNDLEQSRKIDRSAKTKNVFTQEEKKRVLAGEFDMEKVNAAIEVQKGDTSTKAKVAQCLNSYIRWSGQPKDKARRTKWTIFYMRRNTPLFHQKSKEEKAVAISQIRSLGAEALPPLTEYAKSDDDDVALAASEALSAFQKEALAPLLKLSKSDNEKTAINAANGLSKLGDMAVKPLMNQVMNQAESGEKNAGYAAVLALSKMPVVSNATGSNRKGVQGVIGRKEAKDFFSAVALNNSDPRARKHALIGLKAVLPNSQDKSSEVLDVFGRVLTQDRSSEIRLEAGKILHLYSQRFTPQLKPLIPYLIMALDDEDLIAGQAANCFIAIGKQKKINGKDQVKAVRELTKALDRPRVRASATRALVAMGSEASAAVPKLIELLEDKRFSNHALLALCKIDPTNESITKRMNEIFSQKDSAVHDKLFLLSVVYSLGRNDHSQASEALKICRVLIEDKNPKVRLKTTQVIGVYGDDLHMLVPALEYMRDHDPVPTNKKAAVNALYKM